MISQGAKVQKENPQLKVIGDYIKQVPEKGDFDLKNVLKSTFFFSWKWKDSKNNNLGLVRSASNRFLRKEILISKISWSRLSSSAEDGKWQRTIISDWWGLHQTGSWERRLLSQKCLEVNFLLQEKWLVRQKEDWLHSAHIAGWHSL